jgi:hypothetical protein
MTLRTLIATQAPLHGINWRIDSGITAPSVINLFIWMRMPPEARERDLKKFPSNFGEKGITRDSTETRGIPVPMKTIGAKV